MKKYFFPLLLILSPLVLSSQELSKIPGVTFSGAPTYISEFAETFRDNGGPLSPYGSHIGLKAEVESKAFAGILHFACATGKNVLDYSRTGLFALSSVSFVINGKEHKEAKERKIKFEYYGWQEQAEFTDFWALAYIHFLGQDQYVLTIQLKNRTAQNLNLIPQLNLVKKGKLFSGAKSSGSDSLLYKFSVQPTITPGENYLALSVIPGKLVANNLVIKADEIRLAPQATQELSFIFGYHPDQGESAVKLVESAKQTFDTGEKAWQKMLRERDEFFDSLPRPHLSPGEKEYLELYFMSATALDNALYAPRGKMKYWACVPTKVHYNWFWLWDSGFQALGYSEFKPSIAREVILSVFQSQRSDGFIAHMTDETMRPLTPHSQPPVFGFSGRQIIERYSGLKEFQEFKKELYEKSKLFLDWWKRARDKNHNGLFEYLSQDEGGWDNSSRMFYVKPGLFINYVGSSGEVIASRLKPLDNVDLNSWMYFYYQAMADWAEELGYTEEAQAWKKEARTLAEKIDQFLWNEKCECWLDGYGRGSDYQHFYTLTPAIWFPAFAGTTLDEAKARAVIEKHLLNPEEFFGKYPIPVVAYNDPYFDARIPGWRGRIWLFSAYSALETLFKFGYEREALELRERLLSMMANQGGKKGIYETYDPLTGSYQNPNLSGGYASFQFGWSSAFTMEMILERYQRERFLFSDTREIQGFIRRAENFYNRQVFYQIDADLEVPRMALKSLDGLPLLESKSVKIKLTDPYQALTTRMFKIQLKSQIYELELGKEYHLKID